MSLKFTVVARKNLSKGAPEDSKLFYAQARQMGTVGIDELCDEIAETCTLTSADLKCALDRLAWSIAKHAKEGRSVQVGELVVLSGQTAAERKEGSPLREVRGQERGAESGWLCLNCYLCNR